MALGRHLKKSTYAEIPSLGVFKPGAVHPATSAPIKAPALRVVDDSDHYHGKRYKAKRWSPLPGEKESDIFFRTQSNNAVHPPEAN